jgi:hypothetical protein
VVSGQSYCKHLSCGDTEVCRNGEMIISMGKLSEKPAPMPVDP